MLCASVPQGQENDAEQKLCWSIHMLVSCLAFTYVQETGEVNAEVEEAISIVTVR